MIENIKYKNSGMGFLALLISISALSASGYLYYRDMEINKELTFKVSSLTAEAINQAKLSKETLLKLQLQTDSLQVQVSKLDKNSSNFNLLQLNELISMANQSLLVYNDVKSAIKILNYAMGVLNTDNNASYVEIKVNLSNDIEKLNQIQYLDMVFLASKLNIIQSQIVTLALMPELDETQRGNAIKLNTLVDPDASNWQKFMHNFKRTFASLVTISSSDQSQTLQLLPEKEIIVRQNIKLDLLNARIALLDRDYPLWKFNLANIRNNLESYFVKNALTASIINNVNILLQTDISNKAANIDDTLKSLTKLNNNNRSM
ncbi:MAG: uroporphyrinogen-III C-methyltransferase [Proteobacteria bacterium]|jgi:uncharacterized protein HemX|nr:uroporphyrinogen-III C-methyltransferase [Pseudomonadota bacterium]